MTQAAEPPPGPPLPRREGAKLHESLYDDQPEIKSDTHQSRKRAGGFGRWWKALSAPMQGMLITGVALAVVVPALILSDDDTGAPNVAAPYASYVSEYGGVASVYSRILTMTDCGELQADFDTAAANADRETPGTPRHKITRGYMAAADDTLRRRGCYN